MEWQRPVTEVIGDRLWLTMVVSFAAVMTWMALPIGIYSAVRPYSPLDYLFRSLASWMAIPSCSVSSSSTSASSASTPTLAGFFP